MPSLPTSLHLIPSLAPKTTAFTEEKKIPVCVFMSASLVFPVGPDITCAFWVTVREGGPRQGKAKQGVSFLSFPLLLLPNVRKQKANRWLAWLGKLGWPVGWSAGLGWLPM